MREKCQSDPQATNGHGTHGSLSSQFYNPTSQQLRRLIASYLCHHCYVSTAKIFAESKDLEGLLAEAAAKRGLQSDSDELMEDACSNQDISEELDEEALKVVCLRRDIRDHILWGRIEAARTLLNTHFPSVLSPTAEAGPSSYSRHASQTQSTSDPYSSAPPRGSSGTTNGASGAHSMSELNPSRQHQPPSATEPHSYTSPISLDPLHLSLNLHIQSFIESVRTRPLIPSPPTVSESSVPTEPFPAPNQAKFLALAQQLYILVSSLPVADQDPYQQEIHNVTALIAYQIPEESPVAKYLSMYRREAVADQINSAILQRTSQPPVPFLQQFAEHTTVVWSTLEEYGETLPPATEYPPGVVPPLPATSSSRPGATRATKVPVSTFDLAKFVASKP